MAIMEYGSTAKGSLVLGGRGCLGTRLYYTIKGMVRGGGGGGMAAYNVYKIICSKFCSGCHHKPLLAIPVILECFRQQQDC